MYLYRGLSLLHHNQTVRRNNEVRSKSDQANEACLHSALKADFFFSAGGSHHHTLSITVRNHYKLLNLKAILKQFDIYKESINMAYVFDRQIHVESSIRTLSQL